MNKTLLKFLLSLLFALGFGLYFWSHSNNKVSDKKLREFKITEAEIVNKIVLSDGKTDSVILMKTDTNWTVNSSYLVRSKQVEELLRISTLLEAKFRVKNAKQNTIKVDFYSNDENLKSYYLGGNLKDSTGFYAFLNNASNAVFSIHVPGENPDFSTVFSPHINSWRTLTIVQIRSSAKRKIKITYPNKPENSFSMELLDQIPKMFDAKGKNIQKINLEKSATYLRQLKNIDAKKLIANLSGQAINSDKIFELSIEGNELLKAYRKKAEKNQVDFTGKPLIWDNEYFYLQQGNDWYLMDYFTFDGILKTPADFIDNLNHE